MSTVQDFPHDLPASAVPAAKSVEQLQREFIDAVNTLKGITDELTTAQWLRDYDRAVHA